MSKQKTTFLEQFVIQYMANCVLAPPPSFYVETNRMRDICIAVEEGIRVWDAIQSVKEITTEHTKNHQEIKKIFPGEQTPPVLTQTLL